MPSNWVPDTCAIRQPGVLAAGTALALDALTAPTASAVVTASEIATRRKNLPGA
jgi:hypothetical protein